MAGRALPTRLLLVVVLAGCATGSPSAIAPTGPGATSSSQTASATPLTSKPQATPSGSPASTPAVTPALTPPAASPVPASTASTAPPPVSFKPGDTALVVADAVRAHNDHSVESPGFIPMLPKGTSMVVVEGPKHGSGYHWYRVELVNATVTGIEGTALGKGDIRGASVWVPIASRSGEAWVRHGQPRCPARPNTVLELYATPRGARITCFSGVPITVQAQIVANEQACDYDPGMAIRPRWFAGARVTLADGSRPEALLATPAGRAPEPPCPPFDTLLYVDPDGTHPTPLPVGEQLSVTGMFDHPAAATCRWKWGEEPWKSTDACRYWFAATEVTGAP